MRVECLAQEHNAMAPPGLEPRPLDLESSALTTRPLCLPRLVIEPTTNLHISGGSRKFRKRRQKNSGESAFLTHTSTTHEHLLKQRKLSFKRKLENPRKKRGRTTAPSPPSKSAHEYEIKLISLHPSSPRYSFQISIKYNHSGTFLVVQHL